jgi:16S rRNA (adenine1518-N6/adenine1519-N6)-dimethyltransferase
MQREDLQQFLRSHGIRPNKTFGQNFLLDELALIAMVDAAGVTKDDCVIEVGPGIGNLTRQLLEQSRRVIAIEKDPSFVPILEELHKQYDNFSYSMNDILQANIVELLGKETQYRVVANIPYYITGKIVQRFVQCPVRPRSLTLLVQKEVAQNICAKPGQMNLLALSVQLYGVPELVKIVPARSFYPAPKVDSAIVHITFPVVPPYVVGDEAKLFRIAKACFAGKRKQIHNTLVNNLRVDKATVENVLAELQIDGATRPQQLSVAQWLQLTEALKLL